jgi:hypothetical protein
VLIYVNQDGDVGEPYPNLEALFPPQRFPHPDIPMAPVS